MPGAPGTASRGRGRLSARSGSAGHDSRLTTSLLTVLVIAVGHPLLAWWVARRPYWSRLRRAAVEWARELLAQERVRSPRDPRTRAVVVVLVVVWGATALGLLVARLTPGEGIDVPWGVVAVWVVVGIWGVRRRHGLRRTAELKDEPAADGG